MRFKILKIPFEAGNPTGDKGPASAPDLVWKEGEVIKTGDFLETNKNISKAAKGRFLAIGGDHSITYALVKAAKPEALLYFDAHLDCEDDFMPPSHEDVIRAIVNEKLVKSENIFIIGARKLYPKELEFVKKNNINVVKHMDPKLISTFKRIYLSIDIDVFDPSEAPGTNYPEENGIKSEEFFDLLQTIDLKTIVGVDICEINPEKDIENKTIRLAAKIVVTLC